MKKISLALSITILCMMPLHAQEITISPRGKALAVFLDSMRVEELWLAGRRVHWLTGEPRGTPPSDDKPHPHCSAFVAAVAYRLGIYILRPPGHSETLLANAQVDWLAAQGKAEGWRDVESGFKAQALANQGLLVVAAYKSHTKDVSGHIVIVRPDTKDEKTIIEEGPQIIQAGLNNSRSISLRKGFRHHRRAFECKEIRFFAHSIDPPRLKGTM